MDKQKYKAPAVRKMKKEDFIKISEKFDLDNNDEEINEYLKLSNLYLEVWNNVYKIKFE